MAITCSLRQKPIFQAFHSAIDKKEKRNESFKLAIQGSEGEIQDFSVILLTTINPSILELLSFISCLKSIVRFFETDKTCSSVKKNYSKSKGLEIV